jgi:hypothetical protein
MLRQFRLTYWRRKMRPFLIAAALSGFVALPANAGALSCNGGPCAGSFGGSAYATAHCPAAPDVPHLKSGDKGAYDHSVELAKTYADAASARMSCIQDEANADAVAIQAAIKAGVKQQQDDAQAKVAALQTALNNLSRH